jgi:hypothetical protein
MYMRKKFFYVLIGAAIVTAAAWNVGQSLNKNEMILSDVALANVEALANELPEVGIECNTGGEGKCYKPRLVFSGEYTKNECTPTGNPSDFCYKF